LQILIFCFQSHFSWYKTQMSDSLVIPEDYLRGSIREFLQNKSNESLRKEYCPHCGSPMAFITARFWLDGDGEFWDIPLSFCSHCHPEIAKQRRSLNPLGATALPEMHNTVLKSGGCLGII